MHRANIRSLVALACYICAGTVFSQLNFDSLWGVWNNNELPAVERLRSMSYLSIDGYLHSKPDSGYLLATMQYDLAVKVGNKRYQGLSLNTQGEYFGMKGDYAAMLDRFERSLKLFEESGDLEALAKIQSNMGVLLQQLGAMDKAREFYERSVKLATRMQDTASLAAATNNIGSFLLELGDTLGAKGAFMRALSLLRSGLNDRDRAIAMGNLGIIHSREGRADEAIEMQEASGRLAEQLDEDDLRIMVLLNLGGHYLRYHQIDKAIGPAQRALSLAQRTGLPKEVSQCAEILYDAYLAKGNIGNALAMYQLHMQMKDSLRNEEGRKELLRAELRFNFEKRTLADSLEHASELAQLEDQRTIAELRAERNRNRAIGSVAGGIMLLGGFAAWTYSDRKRRKERFEKEAAHLETQALRSQMNPHFIFNALNSINVYVQQNDTDNATGFLTRFARVMRSVLENSRHSEVPLQDDLDTLRGYLELERMRSNEKFDHNISVAPDLDPSSVLVPPLVVQPFVENAIWHGMAGKVGKGHIKLHVERRGNQLVWTIQDDGAGLHAPKLVNTAVAPAKKTSLGTTITRARLDLVQKQHGGKAGFRYLDVAVGTKVEVEIPWLEA